MRRTVFLLLLGLATLIPTIGEAVPTVSIPKPATAIYTPQPNYPAFAWLNHWQGRGVFVMRIEIKSGRVKDAYVQRSTGHKELDAAAIAALRHWRFKPNALSPITKILPHSKDPLAAEDSLARTPVTFVLR
jgi:TonB family protein